MPNMDYAQKALKIFETLAIKKIYYVDDDLSDGNSLSIADVLADLSISLITEKKAEITAIIPTLVIASADATRRSITSFIETKNREEQKVLLSKLSAILGVAHNNTSHPQADFLINTFGTDLDVICIGPEEWERDKEKVLANAKQDSRALCIFDQNLDEKTSHGHSGKKGTYLINDITALDNSGRIFCVIISGDIDISNELEHWREYVDTYTLPSSKFFPLSKNRTDSEELFAEGIQLSSLNALYDLLKIDTLSTIESAYKLSKRNLDKINLFNLNYIVANSKKAKEEGIWQAYTLFRLYNIIQNESIKTVMIASDYAKKFNDNISKVQAINNILPLKADAISPERYTLRYKELYENAEHTNQIHEEIKAGDLFRTQVDDTVTQDYVLLAQPCDLTVRGDSGVRTALAVTMAPITIMDRRKFTDKQKNSQGYIKTGFPLEYYSNGENNVGFVEFNKAFTVAVDVLDLAVLSPDGRCVVDLSADLVCPPQLHSAWQLRFSTLEKDLKHLYDHISRIQNISSTLATSSPDSASFILTLLPKPYTSLSSGSESILPKYSYNGTILDYNLWRIGSVRSPTSTYLLDAYTRHLARIAHDHDFSS